LVAHQLETQDLARRAAEQVPALLHQGTPASEVLATLVAAAEQLSPRGSVSSILVLDKDGLLHNGSSPRLPADYLAAIDGLKPDANLGTCAAAAATGLMVITPDFLSDDKWAELRHLPLALGFAAAWSMPIKKGARVLGTFGTYFRQKRQPSATEVIGIDLLANAAALALG